MIDTEFAPPYNESQGPRPLERNRALTSPAEFDSELIHTPSASGLLLLPDASPLQGAAQPIHQAAVIVSFFHTARFGSGLSRPVSRNAGAEPSETALNLLRRS